MKKNPNRFEARKAAWADWGDLRKGMLNLLLLVLLQAGLWLGPILMDRLVKGTVNPGGYWMKVNLHDKTS